MPDAEALPRGRRNAGDDYRDALVRLLANDPRDKKLAEKARRGTLRISVSAVAREAKRSRGPIAVNDPKVPYHQIYLDIVKAAGTVITGEPGRKVRRLTAQATIRNLREQLARSEQARDLLAQRRSDAVDAARDFERRLKAAEVDLKNARRAAQGRPPLAAPKLPEPPTPVAPTSYHGGNVVEFPRPQG